MSEKYVFGSSLRDVKFTSYFSIRQALSQLWSYTRWQMLEMLFNYRT